MLFSAKMTEITFFLFLIIGKVLLKVFFLSNYLKMDYIQRTVEEKVLDYLRPNKAVIILGARRVGKTKTPSLWTKGYPDATFNLIDRSNYMDFII